MGIFSILEPAEARRTITASTEQIFAVLSDPSTYPQWLVGAQEVRDVDKDFPQPGTVFHHSVGPTEAATVHDVSESLEVNPPRYLKLRVHVGPLRGIVEFRLKGTREGTEVIFRERPAGKARYMMPFVRPALFARNTESLRQLDELVTGKN